MSGYPQIRLRRNRYTPWMRNLTQEHSLTCNDLIWPIFIHDREDIYYIKTMPDVARFSIKHAIEKIKEAQSLHISAIAIFPVISPENKDLEGSHAFSKDNLIIRAIKAIKDAGITLPIICDIALDPYTIHGHDGVIVKDDVENDITNQKLAQYALTLVEAGFDAVAPSDMMDGRVKVIRAILDQNNFHKIPIISYSAKYASNFYGPFRDSVGSKTNLGSTDKKTYQLNPANFKEAVREIEQDILEGADLIMIKPGMPYLDVIKEASKYNIPVLSYQVSGEYAMLKFAAEAGCFEYMPAMLESLLCFKRAGACGIYTYSAIEVAKFLCK